MQLVVPSSVYKESFLEALDEYQLEKNTYISDLFSLDASLLKQDFQQYIDKLHKESLGINLPKGYVPQTIYWLIDQDEYIGRVEIRHRLTEPLMRIGGHIGYNIRPSKRRKGYGKILLALALPKAKELGVTRVLVTCDEINIASKKVIEANGGIFENSAENGVGNPRKLRYWINND